MDKLPDTSHGSRDDADTVSDDEHIVHDTEPGHDWCWGKSDGVLQDPDAGGH